MSRQQGSLLLEVLISMMLGVFLMYGALEVMLTTKRNYIFRQAVSTVEQNGRLALDLMAADIRLAGYLGCSPKSKSLAIGVLMGGYFQNASLNPEIGIRGWEYQNTGITGSLNPSEWSSVGSFNSSNWLTGGVLNSEAEKATAGKDVDTDTDFSIARQSDVIRLWSVFPYVMKTLSMGEKFLNVEGETMDGFPSGGDERLLIVSDCEKSVLVKGINFTYGNVSFGDVITSAVAPFVGVWNGQAMMLNMVQYSLEIPSGRDRPSLYRRQLNTSGDFANKVEVMPGVLNMQILYGESLDNDPDADTYVPANEVTDWKNVVSVRLWLLVETEKDRVLPSTQTVRYYGNSYSMGDNRLRREFTATIALRNRMLGD